MSATTRTRPTIIGGVRSGAGRLVVLVLCAVLLVAPFRSAFSEPAGNTSWTGTAVSSDQSDPAGDPAGSAAEHGIHCGCGVLASDSVAAHSLANVRLALRFVAGRVGLDEVPAPPVPPPPKS